MHALTSVSVTLLVVGTHETRVARRDENEKCNKNEKSVQSKGRYTRAKISVLFHVLMTKKKVHRSKCQVHEITYPNMGGGFFMYFFFLPCLFGLSCRMGPQFFPFLIRIAFH